MIIRWDDVAKESNMATLSDRFLISTRKDHGDGSWSMSGSWNNRVALVTPVVMDNPLYGHVYYEKIDQLKDGLLDGNISVEAAKDLLTINALKIDITANGNKLDTVYVAYDRSAKNLGALEVGGFAGSLYMTNYRLPKNRADKYWHGFEVMTEEVIRGQGICWGIKHHSPDKPGAKEQGGLGN